MFFKSRKDDKPAAAAASPGQSASPGRLNLRMTVNGKPVSADIDPRTLLVQFLRENLRLTGTHVGCDTSQCGACVVHLDGRAVKTCTTLAASCDGAAGHDHRGPGARAASCTRCRRPSASITACSAASARRA